MQQTTFTNGDIERAFFKNFTPQKAQQEVAKAFDKAQGREIAQIVQRYNIGRNDPCPCGSGKKFKNCCIELADL